MLVYKGGIDSIPSSNVADIPKAKQYVRVALDEVLAGKPVTDASTRAYGCTMKYAQDLDLRRSRHAARRLASARSSARSRIITTTRQPTRRMVLAAATFLPFGGASAQTVDAAQRIADAANRFLAALDDGAAQAGDDRLRVRAIASTGTTSRAAGRA